MTMPAPAPANPASSPSAAANNRQRQAIIIGSVIGALVLVVALLAAAFWLVSHPEQAASVRDVFIIFMALEFIVIGAALVVLMFQLAVLTNMLQHEIKPILDSTNETINTVR